MERTARQIFNELTFEFAHYTEVTELAFKVNQQYNDGNYKRFFICPDVHDVWLIRIQEGWNEEYEREEGMYLLERDKIENDIEGEDITFDRIVEIFENDTFENWDVYQSEDLQELIEDYIGDGFGIHNLKEVV